MLRTVRVTLTGSVAVRQISPGGRPRWDARLSFLQIERLSDELSFEDNYRVAPPLKPRKKTREPAQRTTIMA